MAARARSLGASYRPFWSRAILWLYFFLLILLLCAAGFLWKSGELLVRVDKPVHTRWAVVLAGEGASMNRSDAALALFQEGLFDSLIVSGEHFPGDHYSSEYSRERLLSKGFPSDRLFQLRHEAHSTLAEEIRIVHQLRLLGVDTLLLITSDFHTARAGRIFKKLAGTSPVVIVQGTPDLNFDPKAWWSYRESRVTWTLEWLKTVNCAWQLWGSKPLPENEGSITLDPNPRSGHESVVPDVIPLPQDTAATAAPDSGKLISPTSPNE